MMNSDATEATGSLDQRDREATVTTGVAGAEHKTRTGQQYAQIPRPHVEQALAEVGETSRTCDRSNSNVAYGATAEIEMENGNVTVTDRRHAMAIYQPEALEADLCESPPEIVKNDVIRVSPMESTLITDARIDHTTSIPVTGVVDSRKTQCSEEVPPTRFDSNAQVVPDVIAEPEPEELTLGSSLPAAEHVGSARCTGERELLYSDIATPTTVRVLVVDNEDIQRSFNLGEIFSFQAVKRDEEEIFPVSSGVTTGSSNDDTMKHGASSHTVAWDTTQVMTDETFPVYDDNDVANALSHNKNEFLPTPDKEPTDPLSTGKEECFQLGR